MNKEYNGWSNNATWQVMNDILNDIEFDEPVNADQLKEIVEDCVFRNFDTCDTYLVEDYARAFLSEANYYEISEAINTDMLIDKLNITN
jgi:hypothetical protein